VRVLHAASFYGRTAGGFVPLIGALARRLAARGDEIALVAPRVEGATWHGAAHAAGVELHLVDDARDAMRIAAAWKPDLAQLHFFGWEGRLTTSLWRSRTRIFWHVHSTVTSRPNGRVAMTPRSLAKYRLLGARVERFIAVSSAIGEELVHQGAPRARVAVVRNAVDSARFRPPSAAERAAARAALGLGERRAILFFGRHPQIKGADVLARALEHLDSPVIVTVATPPEVRAELARHAEVLALEHVDDVVPLLWAADALAVPSRAEGFGLVLLEAALTGLPVAASDLPALRDAASGHTAVHFAAVDDAVALAAALRAALDTDDARRAEVHVGGDPLGAWVDAVVRLYDERTP
jgi:glycosyltransferase involved in cell wall biosynthesis